MSELSKNSMKNLTKQIMLADLASRKNKIITSKGIYLMCVVVFTPGVYVLHQMFFPTGPILSISAQAGDPHLFHFGFLANKYQPFRALFRPDKLSNLDVQAQKLKQIVEKNENIKFNAYVWH